MYYQITKVLNMFILWAMLIVLIQVFSFTTPNYHSYSLLQIMHKYHWQTLHKNYQAKNINNAIEMNITVIFSAIC